MFEKPEIQDAKIVTCLQAAYGLDVDRVTFLPLGADYNTAVYRVVAKDDTAYFLKLRSGIFDKTSVTLPKFLSDQGVTQIIAPLATTTGQLWADLDAYKAILYPFVEGHDGNVSKMPEQHWYEFGTALKRIHTTVLPTALNRRIRRETYTPQWRERVRTLLARTEVYIFDDPVANELAAFLKTKRDEILDLVARAERYAEILQTQPRDFVLCHSDVHAWNVFIDVNDAFYIVDWDDPILAPKERDLMFIGGAQGFTGYTAREEETLFYRGYGQAEIDPVALAYYRYERIVVDIAVYCEQLLLTDEGGKDRTQSLKNVKSNFQPNGTIARARYADYNPKPPALFESAGGLVNAQSRDSAMLIIMAGLPGTGKSTLARAIADALDAIVLDKDRVRAALFPPDAIEYSTAQDDFCVDVLLQTATYVLKQKPLRPVILDGRTFSRRYQVEIVVEVARQMQTPLKFIECVCDDATALARLARDIETGTHPAQNRDATLYRAVKARFEPITIPHLTVDTGEPLESCLEACLRYVGELRIKS